MTTINVEDAPTARPNVKQHQYVILALAGMAIMLFIASFAFAPAWDDADRGAWLVGP